MNDNIQANCPGRDAKTGTSHDPNEGNVQNAEDQGSGEKEVSLDIGIVRMMEDFRAQREQLLDKNPAKAIYNLPPENRAKIAQLAKSIFIWFHSLSDASMLNLEFYTSLSAAKIPFPIEARLLLFRRELCPRIVDYWRQSKNLHRMAQHFRVDEAVALLALLHYAFNNRGYELDVVPLLNEMQIDQGLYHGVCSFLVSHCEVEGGLHPCNAIAETMLEPRELCVTLYMAYKEGTRSVPAVDWNSVTISPVMFTGQQFIDFDNSLLRTMEKLNEKDDADIEALSAEFEQAMSEMAAEGETLRKTVTDTSDIDNIRRMHDNLRQRRASAVMSLLPEGVSMEVKKEQGEELDVVEQAQPRTRVTGKLRLEARDLVIEEGRSVLVRRQSSIKETFTPAQFVRMDGDICYIVRFPGQDEECRISPDNIAARIAPFPILTEGIRVVAKTTNPSNKDGPELYHSGTIATKLDITFNQYLVFFDENFEAYARADTMFTLLDQSFSENGIFSKGGTFLKLTQGINQFEQKMYLERRKFIFNYFRKYPDWQLVRMKTGRGQRVSVTSRWGAQWSAFVVHVDRQMCVLRYNPLSGAPTETMNCTKFPCNKHNHTDESLYRGIPRLTMLKHQTEIVSTAGAEKKTRRLRRQHQSGIGFEAAMPDIRKDSDDDDSDYELSGGRKREKMRKSGRPLYRESAAPNISNQSNTKAKKFESKIMIMNHAVESKHYDGLQYHDPCSPNCLNGADRDPNNSIFKSVSPYFIPILCEWRRFIETHDMLEVKRREKKVAYYRAPCGKPLRSFEQVSDYIEATRSELTIDLFTFDVNVDESRYAELDRKFVLNDDFSQGREMRPLQVVNEVDSEPCPQYLYRSRRYAATADVDLGTICNEFCSGCSCEGDCRDSNTCECQLLTASSQRRLARSILNTWEGMGKYSNRLLTNRTLTGIYECNMNCSCNSKRCYNRVVQNEIKIPMQLMKTPAMGWGVRTLVDIPAGTFVCNYIGAVFSDEIAENWQGGDEYFADIDLMHVVENEKENVDVDLLEDHGIDDREEENGDHAGRGESASTDEDEPAEREVDHEGDTKKAHVEKEDATVEQPIEGPLHGNEGDSVDEGVGEEKDSEDEKADLERDGGDYKHLFEKYFNANGKTTLYIIDAKSQGNVGRFLNHSCDPNIRVQHVLVDTHDLRLPWVSFFTQRFVKAGEELFWDYGWQPMEGTNRRGLKCQCGASNCRGDLL